MLSGYMVCILFDLLTLYQWKIFVLIFMVLYYVFLVVPCNIFFYIIQSYSTCNAQSYGRTARKHKQCKYFWDTLYIDGLVQDCTDSIANALGLLQYCTKPSISWWRHLMKTFSALLAFCAGNSPGTVIPHTKASDAELWCFLWSLPELTVEQTIETPVI